METFSNYLHFIVSDTRHFVKITNAELESVVDGPISREDWEYFSRACDEIFGRYADFIDITDEISFQKQDLDNEVFVKRETLRYISNVYKEAVWFSLLEVA